MQVTILEKYPKINDVTVNRYFFCRKVHNSYPISGQRCIILIILKAVMNYELYCAVGNSKILDGANVLKAHSLYSTRG